MDSQPRVIDTFPREQAPVRGDDSHGGFVDLEPIGDLGSWVDAEQQHLRVVVVQLEESLVEVAVDLRDRWEVCMPLFDLRLHGGFPVVQGLIGAWQLRVREVQSLQNLRLDLSDLEEENGHCLVRLLHDHRALVLLLVVSFQKPVVKINRVPSRNGLFWDPERSAKIQANLTVQRISTPKQSSSQVLHKGGKPGVGFLRVQPQINTNT
ncbi:hypothetical protein WICPIJ_001346 [Wickerhamomyces pijperi]|uniref:Uncharacterized protein n=1 Tax=Wickerhamomyces pijperi TaxID=599730 RepID=A0A9P8TQQ2_WICPI|nr:hypothetical protein WICPIJ_001346 [Wickerhamomyces pijperi]